MIRGTRHRKLSAERVHLRRLAARNQRPADAAELVLLLEVRNFSGKPALREIQHLNEFRQFGEAAEHSRSVDHKLADGVHHPVEPLERDAD